MFWYGEAHFWSGAGLSLFALLMAMLLGLSWYMNDKIEKSRFPSSGFGLHLLWLLFLGYTMLSFRTQAITNQDYSTVAKALGFLNTEGRQDRDGNPLLLIAPTNSDHPPNLNIEPLLTAVRQTSRLSGYLDPEQLENLAYRLNQADTQGANAPSLSTVQKEVVAAYTDWFVKRHKALMEGREVSEKDNIPESADATRYSPLGMNLHLVKISNSVVGRATWWSLFILLIATIVTTCIRWLKLPDPEQRALKLVPETDIVEMRQRYKELTTQDSNPASAIVALVVQSSSRSKLNQHIKTTKVWTQFYQQITEKTLRFDEAVICFYRVFGRFPDDVTPEQRKRIEQMIEVEREAEEFKREEERYQREFSRAQWTGECQKRQAQTEAEVEEVYARKDQASLTRAEVGQKLEALKRTRVRPESKEPLTTSDRAVATMKKFEGKRNEVLTNNSLTEEHKQRLLDLLNEELDKELRRLYVD